MISTAKKVKEGIDEYRKERISSKKPYKLKANQAASHRTSGFRHEHKIPLSSRLRLASRRRPSRLGDKELGNHHVSLDEDGVDFKAKLIGIQDVDEARGDYMCQNAIQACKASLKKSGHRKQRIWFNLSRNGFKIKERTSHIILFHFPINKISFIAKDITDDRAFGFVYEGLEKKKYKFYGIKTEQQAERVVLDIRDLFRTVYEATLKKNNENNPMHFERSEIKKTNDLTRRYVPPSSALSDAHSTVEQREYEEIPPAYERIMERTKSATEISHIDQVLAESNDLINFNHQADDTSKDPFDLSSFETTIQSSNTGLIKDVSTNQPAPQLAQFDQFLNKNRITKQPLAPAFDAFHQSSTNELPSIPPRSQQISIAGALPRPESNQKNLCGLVGKLLPPPLPKRNRSTDQTAGQSENKDPFADDFFA